MNERKRSRVTRSSKECLDRCSRLGLTQKALAARLSPKVDLGSRLGLTQKELGELTGKSPSFYRRLAHLGLGPKFIRAGGRGLIFPVAAVKEWLDRNSVDPADVVGK